MSRVCHEERAFGSPRLNAHHDINLFDSWTLGPAPHPALEPGLAKLMMIILRLCSTVILLESETMGIAAYQRRELAK